MAFPQVALYFENSILKPDLPLLGAASAAVSSYAVSAGTARARPRTSLTSASDLDLAWSSPGALVDGKPWPLVTGTSVRLPAGAHTVEPAVRREILPIADLNATLRTASLDGGRTRFRYAASSRAIVRFGRKPARMELDARPFPVTCLERTDCVILLPRGEHDIAVQ
jgi:hypothetical protein